MSIDPNFKQFARKVSNALADAGVYPDVYAILNIADALYAAPVEKEPTLDELLVKAHGGDRSHELLVQIALKDDGRYVNAGNKSSEGTVLGHVANAQKIYAIKRLRYLAATGLREAKEAVEDHRVSVF